MTHFLQKSCRFYMKTGEKVSKMTLFNLFLNMFRNRIGSNMYIFRPFFELTFLHKMLNFCAKKTIILVMSRNFGIFKNFSFLSSNFGSILKNLSPRDIL